MGRETLLRPLTGDSEEGMSVFRFTNSDTPCPVMLILGSWGVIYWYQNVMILITGFNQTNEHNLWILEM